MNLGQGCGYCHSTTVCCGSFRCDYVNVIQRGYVNVELCIGVYAAVYITCVFISGYFIYYFFFIYNSINKLNI